MSKYLKTNNELKIVIEEPLEKPFKIWYKDEGGKKNNLEIKFRIKYDDKEKKITPNYIHSKILSYYKFKIEILKGSDKIQFYAVENQEDYFEICSDMSIESEQHINLNSGIIYDKKNNIFQFKYKIKKCSRNCDNCDFKIKISLKNYKNEDICFTESHKINVMSKRKNNKNKIVDNLIRPNKKCKKDSKVNNLEIDIEENNFTQQIKELKETNQLLAENNNLLKTKGTLTLKINKLIKEQNNIIEKSNLLIEKNKLLLDNQHLLNKQNDILEFIKSLGDNKNNLTNEHSQKHEINIMNEIERYYNYNNFDNIENDNDFSYWPIL